MIDGSDFTPIFEMGSALVYGVVSVIIIAVDVGLTVIVDFIVFLVIYLAAVRKKEGVNAADIRFSRGAVWICTGITLLAALIVTRCTMKLTAALLIGQIPLFAYLFYVFPLKKKHRSETEADPA